MLKNLIKKKNQLLMEMIVFLYCEAFVGLP